MSECILTDYRSLLQAAVEAQAQKAEAVEPPCPDARYVPGGVHSFYVPMDLLAAACFDGLSPRRGREELWERLQQMVEAMKRRQHEDGLIDLNTSNFHSPPDTAFMVEELAALYEVVRSYERSPRRDRFLEQLESVIVPACEGIARGGVHTPNHRWKVASALTLADRIWPHENWRTEAQAYLDEGIDIDRDGEFTERSTGCYNCVCDRALILLGRALGRPEYLQYADRNLEHVLYLLHADGTLVTSHSRRQDRHTTVGVERYLLLYWYRALMTGNGRFLSAAELGLRRIGPNSARLGGLAKWLRYFHEAAEKPPPAPQPLPEEYEVRFDEVGVLRRRLGSQSLTLMAEADEVLAVRFGAGPDITMRIAAGLAPSGQFRTEKIEGRDGRYRLRSDHACEYYGPGPDPLPATDWRSRAGFSRRVFVATELTMRLEVECLQDGLRLHLRSEGCSRVPIEVALLIRDTERTEPAGTLQYDDRSRKHFLNRGELILQGPGHLVRIGPGADEHDLMDIPTGRPYPGQNAYCIRLVTPVDWTARIQAQGK